MDLEEVYLRQIDQKIKQNNVLLEETYFAGRNLLYRKKILIWFKLTSTQFVQNCVS